MTNLRPNTIAGHVLTLESGQRYIAGRPFADRGRTVYPVSIRLVDGDGFDQLTEPAAVVDGLTYDEANELLAAFNNGDTSFDGRVW